MKKSTDLPVNDMLEEQKHSRNQQILIGVVVIILIAAVWTLPAFKPPKNQEPKTCLWQYDTISAIPCQLPSGEYTGVLQGLINYSLSPEQNCAAHNVTFPGFNVKNQTRNAELYKRVMPSC